MSIKTLDPDLDSMNPESGSKHWKNLKFPIEDMFQILYAIVGYGLSNGTAVRAILILKHEMILERVAA